MPTLPTAQPRDSLGDDVFSVASGRERSQAVGEELWIAGIAPGVDCHDIEIAGGLVGRREAAAEKQRQCRAKGFKRHAHMPRGRDRRHVAGRELEAKSHAFFSAVSAMRLRSAAASSSQLHMKASTSPRFIASM